MVDVQTDLFFARRIEKHTILFQKSHVSAKEPIRLDINHWFFGRRFLIAILMSHRRNAPIEHFDVSPRRTDLMP